MYQKLIFVNPPVLTSCQDNGMIKDMTKIETEVHQQKPFIDNFQDIHLELDFHQAYFVTRILRKFCCIFRLFEEENIKKNSSVNFDTQTSTKTISIKIFCERKTAKII